jgi:potassium-transporting ATPase KdpC subunit
MNSLVTTVKTFAVITVLCGLAYPLAVTGICQLLFPAKANGSLVFRHGAIIGSRLVGQQWTSPRYFHARPSAVAYNTLPSGASNANVAGLLLKDSVSARGKEFRRVNQLPRETPVPPDMLFSSGSGIDPDISPETALLQVDRIALQRRMERFGREALENLVERSVEKPVFGFLGNARINVLDLNRSLDSLEKEIQP